MLERATSELRGALHRALDAVSAELAHRYATGEASVDDLLGPGAGPGPERPRAEARRADVARMSVGRRSTRSTSVDPVWL